MNKDKQKIIKLANLIREVSEMTAHFNVKKALKVDFLERFAKKNNIDIESMREDDALGYVDAMDYGWGFDANLFIDNIDEYIINKNLKRINDS